MADLSDVEAALVQVTGSALYPNGATQPGAVPGHDSRVFRGWPVADQLDADIASGLSSVCITTKPGVTTNTTRFLDSWQEMPTPPSTMTVALSYSGTRRVATFSGVGMAGMRAGIVCNARVYSVNVSAGDGPSLVATRLAAVVPGAGAFGASITVPGPARDFDAGISVPGVARREARRVKQAFTITVWSPNPECRDAVSALVDGKLGALDWIPLSDGSEGRIQFTGQSVLDDPSRSGVYRRDMDWSVEYATYETRGLPTMLFGTASAASFGASSMMTFGFVNITSAGQTVTP